LWERAVGWLVAHPAPKVGIVDQQREEPAFELAAELRHARKQW
jgi:hypothetical protein